MNTYVLSYNPLMTTLQPAQLLAFIKEARRIQSWYSPFIGTYLLKSEDSISAMNQMFSGIFNGELHTIALVFPTHIGGSLPPAVWNWINGVSPLNALVSYGTDAARAP